MILTLPLSILALMLFGALEAVDRLYSRRSACPPEVRR
jgi:hypothetical protein